MVSEDLLQVRTSGQVRVTTPNGYTLSINTVTKDSTPMARNDKGMVRPRLDSMHRHSHKVDNQRLRVSQRNNTTHYIVDLEG